MDAKEIVIDGGALEGGGQILRLAVVLSVLKRIPLCIKNIRGNRTPPGLRPQHVKCLELAKSMCAGHLWGAQVGSPEIKFHPGPLRGGHFDIDTQTAGSISLLLQVAIPCALFANARTSFSLRGGTNVAMAPQIDYICVVFRRLLEQFGATFNATIERRGFYPKGGGKVFVEVDPIDSLNSVSLLDPGLVTRVWGAAFVAGVYSEKEALKMADVVKFELQRSLRGSFPVEVKGYKESSGHAVGNGSGVNLFAETSTGCIYGGSGLGERSINVPVVAGAAAAELIEAIDRRACVDSHAQDQIILLMALAKGESEVRCGPLTLHTKTAMYVVEALTEVQYSIQEDSDATIIIKCTGTGYSSNIR